MLSRLLPTELIECPSSFQMSQKTYSIFFFFLTLRKILITAVIFNLLLAMGPHSQLLSNQQPIFETEVEPPFCCLSFPTSVPQFRSRGIAKKSSIVLRDV